MHQSRSRVDLVSEVGTMGFHDRIWLDTRVFEISGDNLIKRFDSVVDNTKGAMLEWRS